MNLCGFDAGLEHPLFLIAGNCVIENEETTFKTAETLLAIAQKYKLPLIYKSSFDKANRSSVSSYRGPGMAEGLRLLEKVRTEFSCLLYTSPSPRDATLSRMPSSA